MAVNAGLASGVFVASDEVYHHPVLPLYVVGRWFGRQVATGDATGGTVQASIYPGLLPQEYPKDYFFTIYNLLAQGAVGSGDTHQIDGYSDDWIGPANQRMSAQVAAGDTATENLITPSSIPFWLSWLIRRCENPDGSQLGALKFTWVTNVDAGAYVFHASGLVLVTRVAMLDMLKSMIVRL